MIDVHYGINHFFKISIYNIPISKYISLNLVLYIIYNSEIYILYIYLKLWSQLIKLFLEISIIFVLFSRKDKSFLPSEIMFAMFCVFVWFIYRARCCSRAH